MNLIHWKDTPYFVAILLGIFVPELYLRMHWRVNVLMIVRLATLLACCIAATLFAVWAYPGVDPGTPFTRSFIFIGVCRVIILSSHEYGTRKKDGVEVAPGIKGKTVENVS